MNNVAPQGFWISQKHPLTCGFAVYGLGHVSQNVARSPSIRNGRRGGGSSALVTHSPGGTRDLTRPPPIPVGGKGTRPAGSACAGVNKGLPTIGTRVVELECGSPATYYS